jgi:hypothetical protein
MNSRRPGPARDVQQMPAAQVRIRAAIDVARDENQVAVVSVADGGGSNGDRQGEWGWHGRCPSSDMPLHPDPNGPNSG